MTHSANYYDDLRRRLQGSLFAAAAELPASTYTFVSELLDANEFGVALETMVDVLREVEAPVAKEFVEDLARIAATMKMDYDVAALLAPLVVDGGEPLPG